MFKYLEEVAGGMPFMETIKELADEYRIQLPKFTPNKKEQVNLMSNLLL
jgi:hypothetical protein